MSNDALFCIRKHLLQNMAQYILLLIACILYYSHVIITSEIIYKSEVAVAVVINHRDIM